MIDTLSVDRWCLKLNIKLFQCPPAPQNSLHWEVFVLARRLVIWPWRLLCCCCSWNVRASPALWSWRDKSMASRQASTASTSTPLETTRTVGDGGQWTHVLPFHIKMSHELHGFAFLIQGVSVLDLTSTHSRKITPVRTIQTGMSRSQWWEASRERFFYSCAWVVCRVFIKLTPFCCRTFFSGFVKLVWAHFSVCGWRLVNSCFDVRFRGCTLSTEVKDWIKGFTRVSPLLLKYSLWALLPFLLVNKIS